MQMHPVEQIQSAQTECKDRVGVQIQTSANTSEHNTRHNEFEGIKRIIEKTFQFHVSSHAHNTAPRTHKVARTRSA